MKMDTITILRDLWRKRLIVVAVAAFALLVGLAVVYKISFPLESRKYAVGIASARILVDTPNSQVVEVAPEGSDSLGVRANLLASLMVDGDVKEAIARRAGLPAEKLISLTDAVTAPAAAAVKPPTKDDFVINTHVVTNTGGAELPIIEVEAQAPNRESAAKLGNAAVEGLRDYLSSKAGMQRVADQDRLQVTGLGAPQATTAVRGPSLMTGMLASIVVFLLGCAAIVAASALSRGLRAAAAREALGEDAQPVHPVAPEVRAVPDAGAATPAPARPRPVAPKRPVTPPPPPSSGGWLSAPSRPSLVVTPPPDEDQAESA
jgi:hypothetical protein